VGRPGQVVGVCYLTAAANAAADVSALRVRIEFTVDVSSDRSTTRYAVGPDATSDVVREWMSAVCAGR
jgi:hypothetical protein